MELSIIVPLYNEEKRAEPFLSELASYSKQNFKSYEIILVNDGSTDGTLELMKRCGGQGAKIVSYPKNKGKGGAVKTGIEAAEGRKLVFIDADGSIAPDQIPKMLEKLEQYDVVAGDRSSKDSKVTINFTRTLTGKSFNFLVNLLYGLKIEDTLCGFKGFKQEAGRELFSGLISKGWIFDVELFYKIKKKGYSLFRLPFKWDYRGGSKITPFDIAKMAFQLADLRLKIDKKI